MMATSQQHPPAKLYRYRDTGKNTERLFKEGALYFAAPASFNDPFDCGYHVLIDGSRNEAVIEATAWKLVKKRLPGFPQEEYVEDPKQIRERLIATRRDEFEKIIIDKLSKDTNERVGICCFTEVNDDILMWSHYGDCHRGICLEFTCANGPMKAARPVEYGDEYPSLDLEAIVTRKDLRAAAPWMLRKAKQWSYEREWRVLDFKSGPGAKSFPAACLTGVILGCRISEDDEAKVRRWVQKWPSEISLYRARQSKRSFCIEVHKES